MWLHVYTFAYTSFPKILISEVEFILKQLLIWSCKVLQRPPIMHFLYQAGSRVQLCSNAGEDSADPTVGLALAFTTLNFRLDY